MFRMRSCLVFGIAAMAAISCNWIAAPTAEAQTQIILDEQFDGNAVDTNVFTFSGPGNESFFGRTQLNSPQLPGAFDSPTVANGVLQLEINSFNPFAPGSFFLADEIRTIQQFAPSSTNGFSFETRARFVDDATNPLSPGVIGGIFLFGLDPVAFPLERDEIDFELLSNFPQGSVLTNVFNDDGFTSAGDGQFASVPGLDLTEFNDFRIETTLSSTQFFVNDTLVRNETENLALEPQDFRLNINVQGPEFADAFSPLIQPTTDPALNETFIFEIDSLLISEIDPNISTSALFDTVINVPDDSNVGLFVEIGDAFGTTTTQLNVSDGGSVGVGLTVFDGSEVNISGGTVDDFLIAVFGSEINISGGDVGDIFALDDSEINLFGSDFFLNDLSLDEFLLLDEAFTISDREEDLILSGLLADGTPFSLNLRTGDLADPDFDFSDDFFDPDSTLTVTLISAVPEPSSLVLLGLSGLVLLGRRRKTCR